MRDIPGKLIIKIAGWYLVLIGWQLRSECRSAGHQSLIHSLQCSPPPPSQPNPVSEQRQIRPRVLVPAPAPPPAIRLWLRVVKDLLLTPDTTSSTHYQYVPSTIRQSVWIITILFTIIVILHSVCLTTWESSLRLISRNLLRNPTSVSEREGVRADRV